ncbi:alpha/beta hydrolase [Herbiconiux sp. P15]|uniref:alpha/beta hydrolase n=1 Tax=Herbiconiux liukaitaii TaxID=3342799 RepID=UPI0035B8204D
MTPQSRRRPWYRRPVRVVLASLAVVVVAGVVAAVVSPWPAAMLIRALFEQGARTTVSEMEPYAPEGGIDETLDVPYGGTPADGSSTTLDVFSPSTGTDALPTVVWIHGGAWISGDKSQVRPYVRKIAAEGYTTVSLNYPIAPEQSYPVALRDLNDALAFLVENAATYRIDPSRIVLAGDSAGANLASQLAVLTTNSDYAGLVGVQPALAPEQLAAVVLNCGIYDVSGIPNAPGVGGWGFRVALWSYLGERDWVDTPGGEQMSTLDYVTAAFPRTWISGGNGDPLTATQSEPLTEKLEGLGVAVTPVFYPTDHEPELPHEYQFHLDYADAQTAFTSTIAFLDEVTATG